MAIPPNLADTGQFRAFLLPPGGHGGGKRAAPPLPEGPGEQGEATTEPAGFRRGFRYKKIKKK